MDDPSYPPVTSVSVRPLSAASVPSMPTLSAATLVAALDEQASMPAVQRLRAAAIELLGPQPATASSTSAAAQANVTRALAGIVGPRAP